jgi:hypothetical protein|tara:strand:- start:15 stop:452 length:438 start_codon:yes stop_codon:yes gene_type:complete
MSEMIFSVTNNNVADVIPRISQMINKGLFAGEVVCTLSRPLRTPKQNDKLHPIIRDVKTQVEWMNLITEDEWRQFFTGIIQGQKPVPIPEGGIIMVGGSSRELKKKQMSDCIEYIYAFGSERQVKWSQPSLKLYSETQEVVNVGN